MQRFLNPRNDIAFKRIFGSEKNKDILIKLLNEVLKKQLHKKIVDVTFLSPIQDAEACSKKQSVVDVLCKDVDGCQYIIEMQVAFTGGFIERAQYYASKAFIRQMNRGGKYEDLKEVIFLAFTDFSVFPNKKAYKSEHLTTDNKTSECDLNKLSFTFVDLVKFDEQRPKSLDALSLEEKFYYFLKHADDTTPEELEQLIGQDIVIRKAYDELVSCFWTDKELYQYDEEEKAIRDNKAAMDFAERKGKEEGREEGIEIGEKKGRKEGKKEGKKEGIEIGEKKGRKEERIATAKKMLKLEIALDVIREATGLTEEEINKLKKP